MALQQQDESAESGRRNAVDAALATPPPPSSSSGRRDADWDASPGVDSEDSGFQLEEPVAEAGPTPTPTALVSASPTPAAASSAPAVTLTPLSPTALRVAWRKPTPDVAARPVNLYKIQYRRHGARQFDIEVVKGPQSLFISSFEESSVLNLLALPSFT